jgi:hypothetical protein
MDSSSRPEVPSDVQNSLPAVNLALGGYNSSIRTWSSKVAAAVKRFCKILTQIEWNLRETGAKVKTFFVVKD